MWFKKKPQEPAAKAEWSLAVVTRHLSQSAPVWETREIESALIQARLADHYRDLQLEPVLPSQFESLVHGLDGEAWRRLALAVGTLDHPEIRDVLIVLAATVPVPRQVQAGFVALARDTDALTLALLRQSEVRVEEFARHFAAHLGVGWHGETAEESRLRLSRIDYKRLLTEAEQAKQQADERMEYLRQKQDEEAARRRPRGKQ